MRPVISPAVARVLALAAATMIAGAAWAGPESDSSRGEGACRDTARSASDQSGCRADAAVIDHLPDSFFVGGGGVGPQVMDHGGGYAVWVHATGSAAAHAEAEATAAARVSAQAHSHIRARR
jgi:hypothetical protein